MAFVAATFFYAGCFLYMVASATVVLFQKYGWRPHLSRGRTMMNAGAAMLLFSMVLEAVAGKIEVTSVTDNVSMLVLLSTLTIAVILRQDEEKALLCFYIPPISFVYTFNAILGKLGQNDAPSALTERPLYELLLLVHVGLANLAYAFFFIASLTSVAYVFQTGSLKSHQLKGLFPYLPPLELLDRTLYRLIKYGYALFGFTCVLGFVWAISQNDLLNPRWWLSPKVIRAYAMLALFGVAFHARRLGWLRGRKLAYLVIAGGLLLGAYLTLGFLNLSNYNFWNSDR